MSFVAMVTGATRGLSRGATRGLAGKGVTVALTGRDSAALDQREAGLIVWRPTCGRDTASLR